MKSEDALRLHLVRLLTWQDAHVTLEGALAGLPVNARGAVPPGAVHSAWQLLEHLRLAQWDILEFCRNPAYQEPHWPDDYWPPSPSPPTESAWDDCIAAYLADRDELVRLVEDAGLDLYATIPHGAGQTYLREILLVADHNAYHVGQLVLLRRLLGHWPPPG